MPKDTKTLGNNKARAWESLGFAHKKGCARVLTQPHGGALVKIFGLDDSGLKNCPYYPYDMVHWNEK